MFGKKTILLGILLIGILAISAASASQDAMESDNLTADDSVQNEDIIMHGEDANDVLSRIDDDESEDEYEEPEDSVFIKTEVFLDNEDEWILDFENEKTKSGKLEIYVNDSLKYTKEITKHVQYEITPKDLGITQRGIYSVKCFFNGKLLKNSNLDDGDVEVFDYKFYVDADLDDKYRTYLSYDQYDINLNFEIRLPADITGKLTVKINGKTYDVGYGNGVGELAVSTKGWKLGKYSATITYSGDSKRSAASRNIAIELTPQIGCPNDEISVGERQLITITDPGAEDGSAVITGYKYDTSKKKYIKFMTKTVSVTKGYGKYKMPELAKGYYSFSVEYKIGNCKGSGGFNVEVKKNSAKFKSSISPKKIMEGDKVTVTLKGLKLDEDAYIYVDGKIYKKAGMAKGSIKKKITGLSPGTHMITVYFGYGPDKYFHSKTYYVTVKPVMKLTMKDVKVKRSAKKLVLKAKLTYKGKPVKGEKITFKFNKKTYKAKTNKKGIAKVTIKKSVLKKLQTGRKVKYQAEYFNRVVKKTAKVKK